jgi:hypothetical protein
MHRHASPNHGDQRYREGMGISRRPDDELLRAGADLQGLERGGGHLVNRVHIG